MPITYNSQQRPTTEQYAWSERLWAFSPKWEVSMKSSHKGSGSYTEKRQKDCESQVPGDSRKQSCRYNRTVAHQNPPGHCGTRTQVQARESPSTEGEVDDLDSPFNKEAIGN